MRKGCSSREKTEAPQGGGEILNPFCFLEMEQDSTVAEDTRLAIRVIWERAKAD